MINFKRRALAVIMSVVTLTSAMMGTMTQAFAAETLSASESSENTAGDIYLKVNTVGGKVTVKDGDEDTSTYYLDNSGTSKVENNGTISDAPKTDNGYDVKLTGDIGTAFEFEINANVGYKVSEYATSIDGGSKDSENFNDKSSVTKKVKITNEDQYVTIGFANDTTIDEKTRNAIANIDFSSCRLLVGIDNFFKVLGENILSSYDNVYLIQYPTVEETQKAYVEYSKIANFVNVDNATFSVADSSDIKNVMNNEIYSDVNPIQELKEADKSETDSNVIAVIDTGSSESENVIERVSMLGDNPADDNGHGDEMISAIVSENKDAKIISVKAMDKNGYGTVSSVYAAIKYAIEKKVDYINLSFVGFANEDNSVIADIINEAIENGITVVCAAGNSSSDAKNYVPSNIQAAYVIGAADADGTRLSTSNYGKTVDYNVVATSTSQASAFFTGYISKNKAVSDINNNGLIFSTDYKAEDTDSKENTNESVEDNKNTTVNELPDADTNRKVIIKYLYVDSSLIGNSKTIDGVFINCPSAVLYQSEQYADVYADTDGKYRIVTDAPFVNGTATTAKPLDVDFARGNDNGNTITDGVLYDYNKNTAVINSSVFEGVKDGDFADLQIQLLVPTSLDNKAKVAITVADSTGKILDKGNVISVPYLSFGFKIKSSVELSKEDVKLFVNNSKTAFSSNCYSVNNNVISINSYGDANTIKNIKVVLSGKQKSTFSISAVNYETSNANIWLAEGTDVSKIKVNTTTTRGCRIGINSDSGKLNDPNALGSRMSNQNGTIGIPVDAFGVNFQFYNSSGKSYGIWCKNSSGLGYNHGIYSSCIHVSLSSEPSSMYENYMNCTIKCIGKSTSGDVTTMTFTVITNNPLTGTGVSNTYQQTGIKFTVKVKNGIKLQLQKRLPTNLKNNNADGYSYTDNLSGAKYNIYTSKDCKSGYVGYITTDAQGYGRYGSSSATNNASSDKGTTSYNDNYIFYGKNSGAVVSSANTYYCKEVTAPTGYVVSSNIYKFVNTNKKDSAGYPIYRARLISNSDEIPRDNPFIHLQLIKSSTNTTLTNGNSCYSLEGAEYKVYTNKNCKDGYVGYIVTDKDGYGRLGTGNGTNNASGDKNLTAAYNKNSGRQIELKSGVVYYCKESKAPKGYNLDPTVYVFCNTGKLSSDGGYIYRAHKSATDATGPKDTPLNDPVVVSLQKVDSDTGQMTEALAGAEFTVRYYDEFLTEEQAQAKGNSGYTRQWVIKTDEYGFATLDKDHLVSGDEFYYSSSTNKNPVLPLGTITIQETKAPANYKINSKIVVGIISEESIEANTHISWLNGNEMADGALKISESKSGSIDTSLVGNTTNSKTEYAIANASVTDTITFSNLETNTQYSVRGYLVNESGTRISDIVSKSFTTDRVIGNGSVKLNHTFDASNYAGKKVIAFAFLYDSTGKLVASHNDLTDKAQTVTFLKKPTLSTTAKADLTNGHYAYAVEQLEITDTVAIKDVVVGNSYTLKGYLVDKSTGKTIENTEVTESFTAKSTNQNVEVKFSFDASTYAGKSVVVYEELYDGDALIASHKNINDTAQTVTVKNPAIKTTASTNVTTVEVNSLGAGNATIRDNVELTGLIAGETYVTEVQIMDKVNESPLRINSIDSSDECVTDKTISAEGDIGYVTFTATGENQTLAISCMFTINFYSGEPQDVVVFETLKHSNISIATHTDINDKDQTVTYTPATNLLLAKVDDNTAELLNGAQFRVYRVNDDGTQTYLNYCLFKNAQLGNIYEYCSSDDPAYNLYKRMYGNPVSVVETSKTDWMNTSNLAIRRLPFGTYNLVEVKAPDGYMLPTGNSYTFELNLDEVIKTENTTGSDTLQNGVAQTITNAPLVVDLSFIKIDDGSANNVNVLEGVGFKVYTDKACTKEAVDFYGNAIGEVKTNSDGILTISGLRYSDKNNTSYYIKETTTLDGFAPLDYIIKANINSNGEVSYYKVTGNTETLITDIYKFVVDEENNYFINMTQIINKRGSFTLYKQDNNGNVLTGSEWKLYDSNGNDVKLISTGTTGVYETSEKGTALTLKTDSSGKLIVKGLPLGKYSIKEVTVPNGYTTPLDNYDFTIASTNMQTLNVTSTIKNTPTKVEFNKVDADGKLVAGVKLQVLDSNKQVIAEWTTDGKTNYVIEGKLVVGQKYTLHEVSAPIEYKLASDKTFTVKDTAEVQTIKMVNNLKTGSVTLFKQDSDGNALKGSEWQLFNADGTLVNLVQNGLGSYVVNSTNKAEILSTDNDGVLRVYNLPFGDYYFVENKSPDGTFTYGDKIEFTISPNSDDELNPEITVKNDKIVLQNTGSTGNAPLYFVGAIASFVSFTIALLYFRKRKYGRSH